MSEWQLHIPTSDNGIVIYRCGLVAGQQVMLRKDLVIRDFQEQPTGEIYPKGEVWTVLPGIDTDPVLWFRQANGERHTWDDDAESIKEWFTVV